MNHENLSRVYWWLRYALLFNLLLASCAEPSRAIQQNMPQESTLQPTVEVQRDIKVTPLSIDEYLTNPGMGWQDGPEPFGVMNFPETVSYSNRRLIGWSRLNPAEGVYDWSALDEQLNNAVQDGKQFSFRVYTYVGESYDGNMLPTWVLDQGATLMPSGEPDYSNCIYQDAWGKFVMELIRVYDGNPNLAFIDISGYGNFNEWSWQDEQTEWDEQWMIDFTNGTPSPNSFQTLDGQARRRLADIFIGGAFDSHSCRTSNGEVAVINYAYPGFKHTQLLMPYAGIVQSSQYVYYRRPDVGFRHDCLGRESQDLFDKIGDQINKIWRTAPVVYELCKPEETDPDDIDWLLRQTHASIVHNNNWSHSRAQLENLMANVGYRYMLKSTNLKLKDQSIEITMEWRNTGSAPNYPKMGQVFDLEFYLLDQDGVPMFQELLATETSFWLPASDPQTQPSSYWVSQTVQVPASLPRGNYLAAIAMIDQRTGQSINLSIAGRNEDGLYVLSPLTIE